MRNGLFPCFLKLSVLFTTILSIAATADAAGVLDQTFGTNGTISVGSATPSATVIQPDGKIVLAGVILGGQGYSDIVVIRLNPNGTFDSGFGSNGRVIITTSPYNEWAATIAVAPDGKIVIAGSKMILESGQTDFLIARLNPSENLDTSFGTNGAATVNQGSTDTFHTVAV